VLVPGEEVVFPLTTKYGGTIQPSAHTAWITNPLPIDSVRYRRVNRRGGLTVDSSVWRVRYIVRWLRPALSASQVYQVKSSSQVKSSKSSLDFSRLDKSSRCADLT
jgi:hypothetical protein